MVEQQVPLPEGLRLAAEATGDSQLQTAGRDLANSIERGDSITSGRRHRCGLRAVSLLGALVRTVGGKGSCGCCTALGGDLSAEGARLEPLIWDAVSRGGGGNHRRWRDSPVRGDAVQAAGAQLRADLGIEEVRTNTFNGIPTRGKGTSGEIEASSPDAVVSQLARGLRIESVQPLPPREPPSADRPRPVEAVCGRDAGSRGAHFRDHFRLTSLSKGGWRRSPMTFHWGRVRRTLRAIVRELEAGNDLESVLAASTDPPVTCRPWYGRGSVRDGRARFSIISSLVHKLSRTCGKSWWTALAYPLIHCWWH